MLVEFPKGLDNPGQPAAHGNLDDPLKGLFDDDNAGNTYSMLAGGADGSDIGDDDVNGSQAEKTGFYALEKADLFNILCIPPLSRKTDVSPDTYGKAASYCIERRAFLIVDAPQDVDTVAEGENQILKQGTIYEAIASSRKNAAMFVPRIKMADPMKENRLQPFAPCGAVAGVMARTDIQRGVWKSPAGIEAALVGVSDLTFKMTDKENGRLNILGVNCIRNFPGVGNVVWGTRTLDGSDRLASEWKYLAVRRFTLFLEESLYRGTQWVVFEPNDEPLWAQIRLNVGAFMQNLFRQGAFQGRSPREAYFVRCGSDTTNQNDINRGIVNIEVGFAPLKPAEFVILKFQQMTGKIDT
jgi:phage tail sheath protein FI